MFATTLYAEVISSLNVSGNKRISKESVIVFGNIELNKNYSENDLNNDPIETFAKMLSYNNFIVGNSTFSLIAAFIVESNSSIVVIADPWFREIMHPGFDFKNWIKIENK